MRGITPTSFSLDLCTRGPWIKFPCVSRTKSNIGLWMIYVEFEMREKDLRRAKEVFFRGVRCCPWSKG